MAGETSIPIPIPNPTTTTTGNIRHFLIHRRRATRLTVFIAFVIFSPVILPLLLLCCPFICAVAALLHLLPIRWRGDRSRGGRSERCKGTNGGAAAEVRAGLLERYLDDQLGLVVDACFGSMD